MGRIIFLIEVRVQTQTAIGGTEVGENYIEIPVELGIVLIIPAGVKDAGVAPVAVEAHERQAQIHGVAALGVQTDEAVHVDAVLIVGIHVSLVITGQGDGDINGGSAAGGNLHHIQGGEAVLHQLIELLHIGGIGLAVIVQVIAVFHIAQAIHGVQQSLNIGQVGHAIAVVVILDGQVPGFGVEGHGSLQVPGGLTHEVVAVIGVGQVHLICHGGAVQGVGLHLVRQVVDLKGEPVHAGAVIVVPKGDLGGVALHGQVGGAGDGLIHVGRTCALLPGGIQRAAGLCHRLGGAHEQGLRHGVGLGVSQVVLVPQVLQHQGAHTGDMRCGHGGTGHCAVGAAVPGGVDVATGRGNIRHQLQIGGHAPRGEITHLPG